MKPTGDLLMAITVIYGFNVGIGPDWDEKFDGAPDNIRGDSATAFSSPISR